MIIKSSSPVSAGCQSGGGITEVVEIPRVRYEALMALVPFVVGIADIRAPISDNRYRQARQHKESLRAAGILEGENA